MSDIIPVNKLRDLFSAGKVATGCFVDELRLGSVAQLMAWGGLDFILIDNEHGPWPIDKIVEVCTVARYAKITPIVRVPDYSYAAIAQPLDAGAQALLFPRIENAQQVRDIIQIARYPPEGKRGNATNRHYCDFRLGDVTEAMAAHNKQTMLIFQIETKEALENLDEILSIPSVDAVLIGPNDLSISLGVPGQINSEIMVNAFNTVLAKCKQYNVVPGCHINDTNLAAQWAKKGFRLVSSSADTMMVQMGAKLVNETIKQACGQL